MSVNRINGTAVKLWRDYLRDEDRTIVASIGSRFGPLMAAARKLKIEEGYHNQVDTYYGRVSACFGDFKADLKPGSRILDWGCSMGYTTIELANIYRNCSVTGLEVRGYLREFIGHAVQEAKRNRSHLEMHIPPWLWGKVDLPEVLRFPFKFVIADGFNAPFRDETFDAVYCMNNLYYTLVHGKKGDISGDLVEKRMGQVLRLVKHGGYMFVSGMSGKNDSSIDSWAVVRRDGMNVDLVFQSPKEWL